MGSFRCLSDVRGSDANYQKEHGPGIGAKGQGNCLSQKEKGATSDWIHMPLSDIPQRLGVLIRIH